MNGTGFNQTRIADATDSCVQGGPQIITITGINFDGTGTQSFQFDGASVTYSPPQSGMRALYFDARALAADALLTTSTGMVIRIPFGKQGYIPLFLAWPVVFAVTSAAGNGALGLQLFNFKVMPIIW